MLRARLSSFAAGLGVGGGFALYYIREDIWKSHRALEKQVACLIGSAFCVMARSPGIVAHSALAGKRFVRSDREGSSRFPDPRVKSGAWGGALREPA